MQPGSNCPECDRPWSGDGPCRACGWAPTAKESGKTGLPIYREFPDRGEFAYPKPDSNCTEPGCALTVADHIAETKRLMSRIGVLS